MGADLIEYIMLIEEAFSIQIPDRDATELLTVGQMHEYLLARLPALSAGAIWNQQIQVLSDLLRLSETRRNGIQPSDRFVQDLGFS